MSKLAIIFLLLLGVACVSPTTKPKEASKVKLVFANLSPYPIAKIRVASSHTNIDTAYNKYDERRILNRLIMPDATDTMLLNSFNKGYHSISVFFLVGKDTVQNILPASDMRTNYIITSGTRKYGIYYSEGMEGASVITLKYVLELEATE